MIRSLVLSLVAIFALLTTGVRAETSTTGWIKVATLTIDTHTRGTKTIDLPDMVFRELRFAADKHVTIATVKTSSGGAFRASGGGFSARPGTPSASFHVTKDPAGLKQVEIAWNADPAATGPVKLEIWALTAQVHAERKYETMGESSDGTTSRGLPPATSPHLPKKAAPPPPPVPQPRSIAAAPPPPPPSPAPPPVAESAKPPPPKPAEPGTSIGSRGTAAGGSFGGAPPPLPIPAPAAKPPAGGAGGDRAALPPVVNTADSKPNVCVDANVCTIVDVFFGTDRKQTEGTSRIGFSGERFGKLQLGHAFVTVPKAQRTKGAIPLPSLWDKWVRGVPPEGDPARHFTIPKSGVTVYSTEADFLAAAKKHIANAGDFKDHAFIFVHGFYVTFDNALYRTAQISYDLSPDGKPFGTAFLYSWPSAGDATSYLYDQDSANFASLHLQSFIKTVVDKTGVKNVHIIAHSMGNVALIGALQELARTDTKAKINQIILAAPDVDKQQFETIIQSVEKVAKGITLYASQGDNALALARKARRGLPRAGETLLPPGPAVVTGIDTIDVSAINTDVWSWGHDTYADSTELLADIGTIFTKGDPPAKRSPKLKFGLLKYWIYNK